MGLLSARLMLMWGQRANLAAIIIVMIAELLIAAHIRHREQNENCGFVQRELDTSPCLMAPTESAARSFSTTLPLLIPT